MFANPRQTALAVLLALASWTIPPSVHAAEAKFDPNARALLDEVIHAYKALPAYADHASFGLIVKEQGHETKQALPRALTFARPNRMNFSPGEGDFRFISDGKTLTTKLLEKYSEASAPATLTFKVLESSKPARLLLDGAPSLPNRIVLALLTAKDPAEIILKGAVGLTTEDDRKAKGKTFRLLLLHRKKSPDLRLILDGKTLLVTRIEIVLSPQEIENEPTIVPNSIAWDAGAIATTTPDDSAFAFKPEKGVEKVATQAELEKSLGSTELAERWVGKPAPDFTLTVADGPGKTRKVSKADLAGKVVLLDFWATWCPPCIKELPEVADLVDAFEKKGTKDVVVVALNQNEAEGVDEARKLAEKTLSAQAIDLSRGSVGKLAVDPKGEVGHAFRVEGLPTLMILDAKGIIRSVHVGYDPAIRDILADEVDGLLEGKARVNAQD